MRKLDFFGQKKEILLKKRKKKSYQDVGEKQKERCNDTESHEKADEENRWNPLLLFGKEAKKEPKKERKRKTDRLGVKEDLVIDTNDDVRLGRRKKGRKKERRKGEKRRSFKRLLLALSFFCFSLSLSRSYQLLLPLSLLSSSKSSLVH